jgi:hypothetical protein
MGGLGYDLKPLDPFPVGYPRLTPRQASFHVIVAAGDGVKGETPLVRGPRPLPREDLATSPLIGLSPFSAGRLDEGSRGPP